MKYHFWSAVHFMAGLELGTPRDHSTWPLAEASGTEVNTCLQRGCEEEIKDRQTPLSSSRFVDLS
jgi:hypothetical protein